MNKKIPIITVVIVTLVVYLSSCYNNKKDIVATPQISFISDVVPIMTSEGCGCHNNVNANTATNNAFPFTNFDTLKSGPNIAQIYRSVNYDAIIARVDTFKLWVNGTIGHPGGGIVDFSPGQKEIIKAWIDQGPPYDRGGLPCTVSSSPTYSIDIVPIYNGTCKSSGCHGGRGPVLTYPILVSKKSTLITMMSSGGSVGHPGGVIGLSSCVTKTFLAWINAGQAQ
jgi:hypothetical protein